MKKLLAALMLSAICGQPAFANSFDVAHLRIQGRDVIIIPLDNSFGSKGARTQNEIIYALQLCAEDAGLAGDVIPVWLDYFGKMRYMASSGWTGIMRDKSMSWVAKNINLSLTCQ